VTNKARGAEIWASNQVRTDIIDEKSIAHQKLRWNKHRNIHLAGFPGRHTLWSVTVEPPI
jgi:class 3 adenylate cyclase